MAYGIVVHIVMQVVVIPLSRIGWLPFSLSGAAIGVLIQVVCVGLPISLTVNRYSTAASVANDGVGTVSRIH